MRSAVGRRSPTLVLVVVGVAALLVIPNVTDTFQTFEWAQVAAFATAIVGLNILTGYSGQISLGNGAFMAIGSYSTAILSARYGWPYPLTIPVGAVLSFFGGVLFGIPALRLRGIYLALATFALALSVTPVLNNFDKFTGGHVGITMQPISPAFGLPLSNEQWLYFFDWGIFLLLFLPARLVIRARTGRAWMAIRDSETAAVANGISLAYYKTLAFGVSALYAAVAGSLLVINVQYANPDSYNLTLSLQLLIGVVLGGLAYVWGPILGAALVVWLPQVAQKAFGAKPDIAFGILLILVVLLAPDGAAGVITRLWARLWKAEEPAAPPALVEAASTDTGQAPT
jgi:branched-chain amino acid transport system permease protein